jgi:hypothetical protein
LNYNENRRTEQQLTEIFVSWHCVKIGKIVKIVLFDYVLFANVEKTGARGSILG